MFALPSRFTANLARITWRGAAALSLVGMLAGCTLNPTVEEVLDEASPVVCDKAKECMGEALFAIAFTDRATWIRNAKEAGLKDNDPNARSACDDETLDQCMRDLEATTCPADGSLPKAPCDC